MEFSKRVASTPLREGTEFPLGTHATWRASLGGQSCVGRDRTPAHAGEALTLPWRSVALLHWRRDAARKGAKRWAARHQAALQPTRPFSAGVSPDEGGRGS